MPKYLTEFVGTFFFVLTFGLTFVGRVDYAPLAVGATYAALVYMGNRISGGHFNPALSLAEFLRGRLDAVELVKYIVFQVAGAILAGLATIWLAGRALTFAPGIGITSSQALVVELLFTLLLALIFLLVSATDDLQQRPLQGPALGLIVFAGLAASGGISGGALNPAVALGSSIADAVTGGSSIVDTWIYLVGPLAGGGLAVLVFKQVTT